MESLILGAVTGGNADDANGSNILESLGTLLGSFNIAWFLLIFVLLFRKEIKEFFKYLEEITFGKDGIVMKATKASERVKNILDKSGESDKQPISEGDFSEERRGIMPIESGTPLIFNNDKELINYYEKFGEKDTVTTTYRQFIETLEKSSGVDFSNLPNAANQLMNDNQTLYEIYIELQRIYFLTIDNSAAEKLWNIEDVINYGRLARVGVNQLLKS